jgi:hypothetical protein
VCKSIADIRLQHRLGGLQKTGCSARAEHGQRIGENDMTHRIVNTSLRSVMWSLCRWVRNSAWKAPAPDATAAARISTPRPQSKRTSPIEVRISVEGPARSGSGIGLPLPRMVTCKVHLGWNAISAVAAQMTDSKGSLLR